MEIWAIAYVHPKWLGGAYANEVLLLFESPLQLNKQTYKIERFNKWASITLSLPECAITGATHHSKLIVDFICNTLSAQVKYKCTPFPFLELDEPYTYLGILLTIILN